MSLDADTIVDRRRLRRSLSAWRVIGIVALVALAVAVAALASGGWRHLIGRDGPQIARIAVTGMILEDRDRIRMIDRIARDPNVAGVIVAIDSPGGSTTGGEDLYEALRALSAKKPTVAVIGTLGASAAYMTAIATDYIVARRTSLTGSIGVLFQYGEASKLLDKIGISVDSVKSSPLKAEPTPFAPPPPEAKAMLEGLVKDTYDWFVSIVAERRHLAPDVARTLADGRVFTGHQALEAKLVDALGGEGAAIAWLETARKVPTGLPVRTWKVERDRGLWSLGSDLGAALGHGFWGALSEEIGGDAIPRRLDGLTSLWQLGPSERGDLVGAMP
ncbi:signal peptide peptidase SppA [Segnochrobactrum spirostomi]|uniref:Signal peptide peptidase SppA n=1 Tax=Segnochrobactrum spirostomi TaxID=2608987 RepID=A0A6A7Y302_9HYPH|nr:signal peptide peptidase SppA [Segnochrobactrum spirostomi]MQT12658.1 signal peptide peptidase SppA [Segnochrobactrum spirostomi]